MKDPVSQTYKTFEDQKHRVEVTSRMLSTLEFIYLFTLTQGLRRTLKDVYYEQSGDLL